MPDLYSVILLLQNAKDAQGTLQLDDVSFLMRH